MCVYSTHIDHLSKDVLNREGHLYSTCSVHCTHIDHLSKDVLNREGHLYSTCVCTVHTVPYCSHSTPCTVPLVLLCLVHRFSTFLADASDFDYEFWSVRLSGTDFNLTGKLETFYVGRWGSICNDGFDLAEAQVVCRQLGVTDTSKIEVFSNHDLFGSDFSSTRWFNNLDCDGTEANLNECPHSQLEPYCFYNSRDTPMTCDSKWCVSLLGNVEL